MEAVFLKLFNLSLEAAWLILAVLVLRLALRRAPKNARCVMWGLVGLRLVLPFSVESVLSLLPSREVITMDTVRYDPTPTLHTGVQAIDRAVNPSFSHAFAAPPASSVNPLYVLTVVASWIWFAGMIAMALYFAFSAVSLRRRVAGAVETEKGIRESDAVPSPFVFGLFSPRVYLPSGMDPESRKYVVAHELAHIRRRDYLFKPLAFLVLAVYWFNPLVWLAYVLLCRDIELACDEAVLKELGAGCKRAYSEALLNAVTFHRHVAACPVAFGEGKLKERVKNVLRWKKPVLWLTVLSVLICAALAVGFLTDPKDQARDLTGRYVLTSDVDRNMGGDFWIELREDGTMQYSEGYASSVLGEGTWKLEKDRVTLTERGGYGRAFVFDLKDGTLVYDAGDSDQFTYIPLPDGALFERDGGEDNAESGSKDSDGINADTDFVSFTPAGWRLNVSVSGVARICDDSMGETRSDEVWRGEGFDRFVMWNDFNGGCALLRQGGRYRALDIREGKLYDIALKGDPNAVLTPHDTFWEGPSWLLLDTPEGELAIYTLGEEVAYPRSEPEFYASLFEKSLTSDGAASEELEAVYARIFDLDAQRFLTELGTQSEDVREAAAQVLVHGKSYGDLDGFRETITGHPAGPALSAIQEALDAYIETMNYDNFPVNESHTRWALTFKDGSGPRRVTVNGSSGVEQAVPVPSDYTGVSCETLCWLSEDALLIKGIYPGGTILFLFDAKTGASHPAGSGEFYALLFGEGLDSDVYRSCKASYYPQLLESDPKAFLRGLLASGDPETNLDIAALGVTADGETAERIDALMYDLRDDPEVGELAQKLRGKIGSLMAERTESMTPPTYTGIPQTQEPLVWTPELPTGTAGLEPMPDWVPAKPLSTGSLPVLTGAQIPGFDALPDLASLHEWRIDPGGDAWWDGASLEDRLYKAALALWGDEALRQDTDRGFAFASPTVNGFREEIHAGGTDGNDLVISYSARNDYAETAPYYTGNPVTADESLAAVRAMAAVFGVDNLTAGEPSMVDADGEEHMVCWSLSLDGLSFDRYNIVSYVTDGRVTSFSVTLPAVTAVTQDAPRWYLMPDQALYCVNYARSLSRAPETNDDLYLLYTCPYPVSVTLRWSDFFTGDRDRLTPVYYFNFQSGEYTKEGVPWRDTCTAAVDAYTGYIRMTAGWEEWESPYTPE